MYAANGTGIVLAEKGHFDVSKDLFTQVSTFLLKKKSACFSIQG